MTGSIVLIIVLIFAAAALFLLEILTPMFGLLIAMGTIALVGGVWQAFMLHPAFGWILLVSLLVLTPVYFVILVKWLPSSALGRKVFLRRKDIAQAGAGTPEAHENESLVGKTGIAETTLRPAGAIRIDHRRIIAKAESGMIEKGRTIRVIEAEGMNVTVREIDSPS